MIQNKHGGRRLMMWALFQILTEWNVKDLKAKGWFKLNLEQHYRIQAYPERDSKKQWK